MSPPQITVILLLSSSLLACAQPSSGDEDGGSSATGDPPPATTGGTSAACQVTEEPVSEVDCGAYLITDGAPCGGSDGGGSGTGEPCDALDEDNQAVIDCIVQAEADGVAFGFGYDFSAYGGQYDTDEAYHVASDGSMWRTRTERRDLSESGDTTVYESVDLSDCVDWACIEARLRDATVLEVCHSWMGDSEL